MEQCEMEGFRNGGNRSHPFHRVTCLQVEAITSQPFQQRWTAEASAIVRLSVLYISNSFFLLSFSVANIRSHLAAAVPLQDQILLLGPPYKVPKDSTLQSDETLQALKLGDDADDIGSKSNNTLMDSASHSGAKRLFLFSKKALSDQAPEPTPCVLKPSQIDLPTEAPGHSTLNFSPTNPLHTALSAYERQFILYVVQAGALADGADLRAAALRHCVQEQAVLCRALRAAVSNLSGHCSVATRTRAEFNVSFTSTTAAHAKLLQQFDSIVTNDLAGVPLHPALVALARASGRTMETLQDTVPVERERAWAQQCQTSHQRLGTLYQELDTAFGELGTTADREAEAQQDQTAEGQVEALWAEVYSVTTELCAAQAKRLETVTEGHREVVKTITHALNGDDGDIQNAFTPLREISDASKEIIPLMVEDDAKLGALMEKVANAKTEAMKRMKVRLREVSVSQSSIQRVLASVSVLRDALTQQTENMVHLEHVAQLVDSYGHFLSEIRRRRAYGQAVSSSSLAMMERLAAMREDEVKERDKFLRGPGRHLMPAFFDLFVPTLATPPPLFTPQLPAMTELDTLPDIPEDKTSQSGKDSNPTSQNNSVSMMTSSERTGNPDAPMEDVADKPQQHVQVTTDQLIVSVEDEANATILDAGTMAVNDAELKTLKYENTVLRQTVERMGGKAPRTYIEESKDIESSDNQYEALRKELAEAKEKAQAAEEALRVAQQQQSPSTKNDKISHSSFEIGDVGLFMPTGRAAGKPLYLAFHTGCPNRFLSTDCVKGTPDFVLGRIVYQEQLVAGEMGTDSNPYGLHVGTTFYILTVEVLAPGK